MPAVPRQSRGASGRAAAGRRAPRPAVQKIDEQHAEWLGLLRPEGPFLTVPVLVEALPHGLDTVPNEIRDRIRRGWAEVQDAPDLLGPAWVELVLGELLKYPASAHADDAVGVAGSGGFRPDAVLSGPQPGGGRAARLHVHRLPFDASLTAARGGRPSPVEQAAQVCRDTGVPLALVTNGQHWALVHARRGEPTGVGVFDADLWLEEPALLRAFATLLAAPRVLIPPAGADGRPSASLAGLFARSAEALTQITTTLGDQVRRAVELFVGELARLDRESEGQLLGEVSDREIYRGALTVLMRLVFLLYAEEQRLLPVADPLYAQAYAASTLHGQLRTAFDMHSNEIGDRRTAAWPRLLALFAAVHGGCEHPDLRIAAHGGSLFDPGRFPWLVDAAVTDRVVHEMLDALLVLRHRGKAAEQLSYSSLGVEQLGHVYEGLLEFSCARVREPYVGLIGKREPELPLAELEAAAARGEAELRVWLVARCDLTVRQVERARAATPAPHQLAALHAACDNDADLTDRVRPYWGLLRVDLRDLPTVFPAGSVLFTQFGDRRNTGTHYTPRELAEEVVRHTLAPLCFSPGPAQGVTDEGVWRAKTADELLRLKVLDPAMGSGAFLVAACRYLAEVVVRAWQRDGLPAELSDLANGNPDQEDLLLAARRLVAARCLYGVDRDDMAVELAKLSLWLVTLAKGKPFGFLDHALRCGDSLVGITSLDQLTAFHLDPEAGRFQHSRLFGDLVDRLHRTVGEITALRESIGATVVEDTRDAADKDAKLAEVEHLGRGLRLAADAVVGAALSTAVRAQRRPWDPEDDTDDPETKYDGRLLGISDDVHRLLDGPYDAELEQRIGITVAGWLRGTRPEPIRPLHWPLEFPEVVNRAGFDAVIGNPPFVGGQRLTGAIGPDVREYLVERIGRGKRGSADLCSYFLLRNLSVTGKGRVGIIATNTIAQGDTREVGLDQAVDMGWTVYRANKSQPWPGTASLEVSLLWVGHAADDEQPVLDGNRVPGITPSLDARSRVTGNPYRLTANAGQSYIGSYVLGTGFLLEPEQAQALIDKDPRNKDVLFPYLNGEDLNSRPDCSARRRVINFHNWSLERAQEYPDCFAIVEREVKPFRATNNRVARRERWWQFAERAPALYSAIEGLDRVLVIARVSKTGLPVFAPTKQVLSDQVVVFATDQAEDLASLSSSFHFSWWTTKGESSLRSDPRYTPSDGFETFPMPEPTGRMAQVGAELDSYRRSVMLGRELGLTKLYNLVHDEQVTSADIRRLRDIHVEIDEAVAEAYGFNLTLGHGFHRTRQGVRFTIDPTAQVELLDLLLDLNHQRHEQEKPQQTTTRRKPRKQTRAAPRPRSAEAPDSEPPALDGGLFPLPDALF
ncbi:Methyltransferase domain-containing protein [Micromonospora haikouensis]|uniref:site-specific DNA-methyltransferase (adenine-specific) n=1 Tax=Micromonospora haikouensis TaxID=686309 RepID=A0A1C4TVJ4_9ACTN|nr:DNA methyltransferase [Micromonospora haikouensis]SCE63463.1 Methyltransferase domain-containing protein [Micromonospora haikouensis]